MATMSAFRLLGIGGAQQIKEATDRLDYAALAIGWAFVCDMLDGRIARMTKSTTEIGIQLDSLADIVSFGLAPAILAYVWGYGTTLQDWTNARQLACGSFTMKSCALASFAAAAVSRRNAQGGQKELRWFADSRRRMPGSGHRPLCAYSFEVRAPQGGSDRDCDDGPDSFPGIVDGEYLALHQLQIYRHRPQRCPAGDRAYSAGGFDLSVLTVGTSDSGFRLCGPRTSFPWPHFDHPAWRG